MHCQGLKRTNTQFRQGVEAFLKIVTFGRYLRNATASEGAFNFSLAFATIQ